MASVYKRGNRFKAEGRLKGEYFSKTFDTKLAALRWAEEKQHNIESGGRILTA